MLFLYILYDRFLRSPQNGAARIAALINKDGLLQPDRAFAPRLPIALKRLPETHLKELKSIYRVCNIRRERFHTAFKHIFRNMNKTVGI